MTMPHDRLTQANALIGVIASCGRQFFRARDRVAFFELDARNRVWFTDDWTGKRVYMHYKYRLKGFSGGGTLEQLCRALVEFIKTGKRLDPRYFGPRPAHICGGDLWGYGDDIRLVQNAAERLVIAELREQKEELPCDVQTAERNATS